jgi:hypothetical protein
LALREAIPVRSAEYWMETDCPELAVEKLDTLNSHARQHPWAWRDQFKPTLTTANWRPRCISHKLGNPKLLLWLLACGLKRSCSRATGHVSTNLLRRNMRSSPMRRKFENHACHDGAHNRLELNTILFRFGLKEARCIKSLVESQMKNTPRSEKEQRSSQ